MFLAEANAINLTEDAAIGIGILVVIVITSVAVYNFILASARVKEFEEIRESSFKLDYSAQHCITNLYQENRLNFQSSIGLSVVLLVLSVIPSFINELIEFPYINYLSIVVLIVFIVVFKEMLLLLIYLPILIVYGLVVYLFGQVEGIGIVMTVLMAGAAIYNLIKIQAINHSKKILLQEEDYSIPNKNNKLLQMIAGVYWSAVIVIYLIWGFVGRDWKNSWLIFPVSGLLFGIIASLIEYRQTRK